MPAFLSHHIPHKKNLKEYQTKDSLEIKYKAPLILRIYGLLNNLDLKNENRLILNNWLEQYSDLIGLKGDIYGENSKKSLNQLFLMAFRKAKDSSLINELYQEYLESFKAICQKNEIKKD